MASKRFTCTATAHRTLTIALAATMGGGGGGGGCLHPHSLTHSPPGPHRPGLSGPAHCHSARQLLTPSDYSAAAPLQAWTEGKTERRWRGERNKDIEQGDVSPGFLAHLVSWKSGALGGGAVAGTP